MVLEMIRACLSVRVIDPDSSLTLSLTALVVYSAPARAASHVYSLS